MRRSTSTTLLEINRSGRRESENDLVIITENVLCLSYIQNVML